MHQQQLCKLSQAFKARVVLVTSCGVLSSGILSCDIFSNNDAAHVGSDMLRTEESGLISCCSVSSET